MKRAATLVLLLTTSGILGAGRIVPPLIVAGIVAVGVLVWLARRAGWIDRESLGLTLALVAVWFAWSGHFEPLFAGLGMLSCGAVVAIALRMNLVDGEFHTTEICLRGLGYGAWLLKEIVKANLDVARRILTPALPIAPRTLRVPASQASARGQVAYANSITLTPGTISLEVEAGIILVHALSEQAAADLQTGEMDRRVSAIFGTR